MPRNPSLPARNSATATSFAAFRTVGAPPPGLQRPPRQRQAPGTVSRSGCSKVSVPTRGKIKARRRRRRSAPARPGNARSGCACRARRAAAMTEPSRNSTRPCTIDCGCTSTSISSGLQRKQMMRLDHLQALVHQRRRIDRDLRTHRPIRMLAAPARASRRGSRPRVQVRNGPPEAVRITRRTSSRRPPLIAWNSALCSESTGSTVAPAAAARRMNSAAGADQTFLVGERDDRAAFDRRKRRARARPRR